MHANIRRDQECLAYQKGTDLKDGLTSLRIIWITRCAVVDITSTPLKQWSLVSIQGDRSRSSESNQRLQSEVIAASAAIIIANGEGKVINRGGHMIDKCETGD